MTVIQLPDADAAALTAKAAAAGLTLEAWLKQLAGTADEKSPPPPSAPHRRHISDAIRERMSKIPPEVMATLPKDGASQHDHYIYGLPKRDV
jgi:hypothetical protein